MVVFLRGANIYLSLSWLHNKIKRPHHCLLPKQLFVTNICLYLPQQIILTNIEMLTDSNIKQLFFCVSPVCVLCQYCGSPAYHQFIRIHLRDPPRTFINIFLKGSSHKYMIIACFLRNEIWCRS